MMLCSNDAMNMKIERLAELEAQKREIDKRIDNLKDEIKLNLTGMETVETDKYVIRWQAVEQNRFDTTSFKKIHTALYEQFVKPIISNRFTWAYR